MPHYHQVLQCTYWTARPFRGQSMGSSLCGSSREGGAAGGSPHKCPVPLDLSRGWSTVCQSLRMSTFLSNFAVKRCSMARLAHTCLRERLFLQRSRRESGKLVDGVCFHPELQNDTLRQISKDEARPTRSFLGPDVSPTSCPCPPSQPAPPRKRNAVRRAQPGGGAERAVEGREGSVTRKHRKLPQASVSERHKGRQRWLRPPGLSGRTVSFHKYPRPVR